MTDQHPLTIQARSAWAAACRGKAWTLFVRQRFAKPTSEPTAAKLMEEWAADLRSRLPGTAVMAGVHSDTERRHVHALIYLPRRVTCPLYPPGVTATGNVPWELWLALFWKHGQVWAQPFDRAKGNDQRGPAHYVAKDPGASMLYGHPPPDVPTSRRNRLLLRNRS